MTHRPAACQGDIGQAKSDPQGAFKVLHRSHWIYLGMWNKDSQLTLLASTLLDLLAALRSNFLRHDE